MVADPIHSDLARRLATARVDQRATAPAPRDLTPEEAYTVQSRTVALLGGPISGYKIGLTTPRAQAAFAWLHPIAGRLRPNDLVQSPACLIEGRFQRFAEAELLFEIGDDLPASAAPFSEADVAARISGLLAGIELCASRYAHEEVTIAELIADNGNADLLVVGSRLAAGWDDSFAALPVTLHRNGQEPVAGATSAVLGNPLRSVVWLANWLAARGEGLQRGQIIASGSCTGITALDGEEQLTADFGGLGAASVTIAPARH